MTKDRQTVVKLDLELGREVKAESARLGRTMKDIASELLVAWLNALRGGKVPGPVEIKQIADRVRKPRQLPLLEVEAPGRARAAKPGQERRQR